MKYIKKGKEPKSLIQYRQQKDAYFDGYDKDALRDNLLTEQKHICCYCMQRIYKEKMRIEHWQSQTDYPKLQLTYNNLLGACIGNEGLPKNLQHCDVHRGNTPLKINPTFINCESLVKFKKDGAIYSDDADINKDLNKTLNLNEPLKDNRAATLKFALTTLEKESNGMWTREFINKAIARWESINNEQHQPYCQIVIYHLKKKLNNYSK